MVKGITSTGYEFEIDDRKIGDFRFLKALRQSKSRDPEEQIIGAYDLVEMVLGKENVDDLCNHVAEPDGFVATEKMLSEVTEILQIVAERNADVKNL